MWGQYKTLLFTGASENVVEGAAYQVLCEEDAAKLVRYETGAYEVQSCEIKLRDGEEVAATVVGKTFVYAGDGEALKEGRFDRVLWAKQMGQSFPMGKRLS